MSYLNRQLLLFNVSFFYMSKFFLVLSAFAMILSVMVCVSHVHASVDTNTEISISIDVDDQDSNSLGSKGCDMSCAGCCVHHATNLSNAKSTTTSDKDKILIPDTTLFASNLIYSLKRPPKV